MQNLTANRRTNSGRKKKGGNFLGHTNMMILYHKLIKPKTINLNKSTEHKFMRMDQEINYIYTEAESLFDWVGKPNPYLLGRARALD